ncbi:hypothetical protein L6R53_15710 [Myxococcota bacterium]|nr:hypothetical protein [Myxococcota bacterium]
MSLPARALSLALLTAVAGAPRGAQAGPATTDAVVEDARRAPRPLDFSAWTLEPGELNLGPGEADAGLMRGLTLGTDPALDALGVVNGRVRVALREREGGAVTLIGGLHSLQLGGMQARQARVGLRGSVVAGPLTLHAGAQAAWLSAQGSPDLAYASPLVEALFGAEALVRAQEEIDDLALELEGEVRSLALRGAAQLHLSGAHSLVLQAGDTVARSARLNDDLSALSAVAPASLGLAELLSDQHGQGTWGALGWQASWQHIQLRLGLGISDVPFAWLAPTTELAVRLGGRKARRDAAPTAPTARADRPTEQAEQAEQAAQASLRSVRPAS